MGLAASQGRVMMLTSRKSDLEFQVQVINERRTALAEQSSLLAQQFANAMYQTSDPTVLNNGNATAMLPGMGAGSNITPTNGNALPTASVGTGWYESQMAYVQSLDKALELREKDLQTQNKEVETELDAVQKVIDKNIQGSFKTLG